MHCGSRWCRCCGAKRAREAALKIEGRLRQLQWPAHIVLTIANVPPGQLVESLDLLNESFRRLRQREVWKDIKKGVWSFGLTRAENGWWHPHLHIAADVQWLNKETLAREWAEVTRGRAGLNGARIIPSALAASEVESSGTFV